MFFNYCHIRILLVGLVLCIVSSLKAQNTEFNFKHYTINEGLSQNTVYCLLEDKEGFIWIGTEDGLNKFDGYDFTLYKNENRNPASISHNQVHALYEDEKGRIWVGTSDGLNIFDKKTETFTRVITSESKKAYSSEYITSIYEDKKGDIWVTSLEGLKLYDRIKQTFQLYSYSHSDNTRADEVMEDNQGLLWVSVGRDLRRFDPVKKRFFPLPDVLEQNQFLRNSFVRVIRQDEAQKIWIGTETSGLFVYDPKANTLQHFRNEKSNKNSLPTDFVREIFFNSKDEVWIGTRDGLSIFNERTKKLTTYKNDRYDPASLSHNSVRAILKDRAGNIWLGTFSGGVNLITPSYNTFNYVGEETPNKPGLAFHMVSSIAGTANGALWIGTEGKGLNVTDRNFSYFRKYAISKDGSDIALNTIKCLLPEGNNLWIGTSNGLSYFNSTTGSLEQITLPFTNREVTSVVKTGDELWVGTNGAGLILVDRDGRTETFLHNATDSNSISRNNITRIVTTAQNHLWIGTSRGLTYFDRKRFKQFHFDRDNPYSISNNHISTLLIDRKNRVWVGTKGGGLNLFDPSKERFYEIDIHLGLANDVIHAIEEDNQGNLWVSTNKGISKITIKGTPPFTDQNISISNYFVEDGLQSNQFFRNSSYKNAKGELFFGGINGLTYFHPERVQKNPFLPPVVLTEFMIRNKTIAPNAEDSPIKQSINETEEITLSYDQAFITFRFAALNYVNPAKNQYAYKLEGFEGDDWHFVGNQRLATYTNLGAGTYTFMVKASNDDGIWNDQAKMIRIIVLPPWWKTWWAYLLYVLIIGGLIYSYYSYSLKTAKLKNELAYEHLVRAKDQELYQRKLNFFTNISHEIKTPLTLILAPLEKLLMLNQGNNRVQHQLMLMKRNGDRLERLISQLLDFRKFESGNIQLQAAEGNIVHFAKEVVSAFEAYARHLGVNLSLKYEKKNVQLWFDQDKFEKILYNLLSNALKFTRPGGAVTISIKEETPDPGREGFVIIEVEDNGTGISADRMAHIFEPFKHYDVDGANLHGSGIGLAFTKGLVELHSGQISVESRVETEEQNGRTCFAVRVPKGNTHLKEEEMVADHVEAEFIEDNEITTEPEVKAIESLAARTAEVLSRMDEAPVMLIVEDNQDVMSFLREHFEDKFLIHTAFNGKEGVDKAIELLPDIIISDVMMPQMTGTELCRTLKTDNRTSHIPIILLTARTPIIYKIEGLETGADDYMTKPFNVSILEARVFNLLEQRQHLRERFKKEITLQPKNVAITSPDEEFLEKVMAYIEANISEPSLNVEDLAKEVFMSRTTLYRKIKALTNQTTVELIRSVRLKRAAQLLQANAYNVNEVAFMTGFNDINYFRKCFKEQFKQTPSEYQNKVDSTK